MNIRPIRTESDYEIALGEISAYIDNEPALDSEEGDRFEILATLVEAYEAKHYPIELPDPIEAIRFRMEQGGLTVKDLVPSIGQLNRVYEVLNRKRGLTLEMIRNLHRNLGIPAESLIGR
ncbi:MULTISPECIES: transcriptional regulator [Stenotrophomonas]|jgi:HTH-type transcriptional regulator/antitoxin HigA|uniref:helix-turn-helix domain-containing protein n=1 Tax=Stenotrophomonas TaxID=40323 RepID=UPI000B67586D|nr:MULTISPECIES: transcriptional regulator [Stenotrophomonas]QII30423.1 transcriptional regulator [Stenotrophomonas maltophilia]SMR76241.1 HTH-type transcriptional regulator / antitoxin HigA [Stenotrophomonas sp. yr243]SNS64419.1 HTH-type transcriptional regulator / antitoxin HigA [Stenotrophomonas lactitubi]